MKAIAQELGSGRVRVIDAPVPAGAPGHVLVRSRTSLISSGTESMLLEFGRSSLAGKIRAQPERVRQVVEKIGTDGLLPTLEAVRDRLGDTIHPGYCQAGTVVECGDPNAPFAAGDRVATNGPHAGVVRVPYHLAARIPDAVGFEAAAFTPLAAIALQGLRLAVPTLGETVVVYGLGLVGQLAVQLVRANGCRCIGIDTDAGRVALAETFGAIGIDPGAASPAEAVLALTGGVGADAVLMTLATDSDEPMHQAAVMSRQRGRIVLVGVTGLALRRSDFYEKELTFQVSCSYGPGRYDPGYEEEGRDYPLPFVRWTEQRNFEAVLQLMATGGLDPAPLVSHRWEIARATEAYDALLGEKRALGIVLTYPETDPGITAEDRTLRLRRDEIEPSALTAAVIGAGGFARRTLIPAMRDAGFEVRTIVSSRGLSAAVEAREIDADRVSTDVEAALEDPDVRVVFVLTRHDSHAELARRALDAGKHVFVEKPLALTAAGLADVREALAASEGRLLVGFNRRFAPLAVELRDILAGRVGPASLVLTVNAGQVPPEHWVHDPVQGGGRIVGEACHFIDLARHLVGHPITDLDVRTAAMPGGERIEDLAHLTLAFEDGSIAAIHYLSSGARSFPKERVEAFFDGKTATIENWRRLRTWALGRWSLPLPGRMDKGHAAELSAFAESLRSGAPSPIPAEELFEVSRWSLRAASLARGEADPTGT